MTRPAWREFDIELFAVGDAPFTVSSLLKVTLLLVLLFWLAGVLRRWLRPTLVGVPLAFELCVWHEARGPVRRHLTSDLNRLIDERLRASGIQYA